MGREVRLVPADWEHPRDEHGKYKPLFNDDYVTVAWEWMHEAKLWSEQKHPEQDSKYNFYWEWSDMPPEENLYRPAWIEDNRTHFQMYETTSEGTPISPVMETKEELAHWLADNNANAFGGMTATYEEWLTTIERGWAVSLVGEAGKGLVSGVEGMRKIES
ncbi:hypothetical protein LCGC14_1632770 [marine sediment metagenome]|uniref:Uncharacterized protein n=1 Tax=marine sediment metagenome TaxID=412755 RepID=A0A0F9IPD7_9ZZZZ